MANKTFFKNKTLIISILLVSGVLCTTTCTSLSKFVKSINVVNIDVDIAPTYYNYSFDSKGGTSCPDQELGWMTPFTTLPYPTRNSSEIFSGWYDDNDTLFLNTPKIVHNAYEGEYYVTETEDKALSAKYGVNEPYRNSNSKNNCSEYRDTDISFNSVNGAVRLTVPDRQNPVGDDSNNISTPGKPFDVGVYLNFDTPVNANEYKYIIIGFYIPFKWTASRPSETIAIYPFVEYNHGEAQPNVERKYRYYKEHCAKGYLQTATFNYEGDPEYYGTLSKIRVDYFNSGVNNQGDLLDMVGAIFDIYYIAFVKTQAEIPGVESTMRHLVGPLPSPKE